jgi:hypothetical protein
MDTMEVHEVAGICVVEMFVFATQRMLFQEHELKLVATTQK